MTVEIVELTEETAHHLDHLEAEVFDEDIRPHALKAFLEDPRHFMVLAIADGRVVGMASGTELFHPDKDSQLFVNEVGVAPAWQNQGIGKRLVSALLDRAKRRGCTYAWVGTEAG